MTPSDYLRLGLALVPLHPNEKRPVGHDWQNRPVTDEAGMARLEGKGVGLHHKASGTVVLDVDCSELTKEALSSIGLDLEVLLNAPGPKIKTPNSLKPLYRLSDGLEPHIKQLKFVNPQDRAESITVFELRANGQDALPPSVHPSGVPYALLEPPDSYEAIPLLPEELRELYEHWRDLEPLMQAASPWYTPPKVANRKANRKTEDVIEHFNEAVEVEAVLERNGYRRVRDRYLSPSSKTGAPGVSLLDGRAYSHHAGDVLNDGYAHDAFDCLRLLEAGGEWRAALDMAREEIGLPAFKRDKAQTKGNAKTAPKPQRTPKLVFMDTVEAEEVSFLWHPYIPLGKLTLLEGDPGLGKTFICLALAAAVTHGGKWPKGDGETLSFTPSTVPPSSVIYMTAEDGLADTLKPRLVAAGADCSRVAVLQGYTEVFNGEEVQRALTLKDIDVLEKAVQQTGAKLVVVDPVQGYLGADTDMHRANEVRPILAKLGELAETYRCAVLGVRHLNKSNKGSALLRGLGSVDFTAFARSQLVVGKHGEQRVVAHVKSSLAPPGSSLVYDIQEGRLVWLGLSEATPEDVAFTPVRRETGDGAENKLEEAKAFIRLLLDEGPKKAKDVQSEAREEGVSKATLKRAKEELGVKSTRVNPSGEERGKGEWYWHDPAQLVSIDEQGELIVQSESEVTRRYAQEPKNEPLEPLEETPSDTRKKETHQDAHMNPLNDTIETPSQTGKLQGVQEAHGKALGAVKEDEALEWEEF